MDSRIRQEPESAGLVRKHYQFTIEEKDRIRLVKVDDAKSLEHAFKVLRKHFPFDQWRIVNIAETLPLD